MLEDIISKDKEIFLFLNGLGQEPWDGFWLFVTNKWTSIPLYALLLYATYRSFGLKRTGVICLAVALMILASDQLANFFKYGVQRLRPCYDPEVSELVRLVKASCGGKFGFYSAHAANSMAVAVYFGTLWKRFRSSLLPVLLLWSLLVAYSRIYIGVHYPSDVVTGAVIGALLAWIFGRLTSKAFESSKL